MGNSEPLKPRGVLVSTDSTLSALDASVSEPVDIMERLSHEESESLRIIAGLMNAKNNKNYDECIKLAHCSVKDFSLAREQFKRLLETLTTDQKNELTIAVDALVKGTHARSAAFLTAKEWLAIQTKDNTGSLWAGHASKYGTKAEREERNEKIRRENQRLMERKGKKLTQQARINWLCSNFGVKQSTVERALRLRK